MCFGVLSWFVCVKGVVLFGGEIGVEFGDGVGKEGVVKIEIVDVVWELV